MVEIIVSSQLLKQLKKIFGIKTALEILDLFETLQENPKKDAEQSKILSTPDFSNLKGKEVGRVGNIVIKELKYNSYRFYFVCDNFKIKFLKIDGIKDLVIKFIKMSKKNTQQETINEIKQLLKNLGFDKI